MKEILRFPDYAQFVIEQLNQNQKSAYFVGGCVRDMLLGRLVYDYDICTNAHTDEIKSIFSETVDIGIKNGTVTVIINGHKIEVTTYRIDGDYQDHRHPDSVKFTDDLNEDLKRRDFTINALCYNPQVGLIDPFSGILDLDSKIIRAIGNPEDRFSEDALRMMRAVRFKAALGFCIEDTTKSAIQKLAYLIQKVSRERIQAELNKILLSDCPEGIFDLADYGLSEYISLYLDEVLKKNQNRKLQLIKSKADLKVRLSILLMFEPLAEVLPLLSELKYSNEYKKAVSSIIEAAHQIECDKILLKKLLHRFGKDILVKSLYVYETVMDVNIAPFFDIIRDIEKNRECYQIKDLKINGNDLKGIGIFDQKIGIVLNILLNHVIEDNALNKKEKLLEIAKNLL